MFSMVLVGSGSVSFDTDPDSGSSHFLIRILIQGNDTDSTDPDPQHWWSGPRSETLTCWLRIRNVWVLNPHSWQKIDISHLRIISGIESDAGEFANIRKSLLHFFLPDSALFSSNFAAINDWWHVLLSDDAQIFHEWCGKSWGASITHLIPKTFIF